MLAYCWSRLSPSVDHLEKKLVSVMWYDLVRRREEQGYDNSDIEKKLRGEGGSRRALGATSEKEDSQEVEREDGPVERGEGKGILARDSERVV